MDVCRSPGVVVVHPRVGARLDRGEAVVAVRVGDAATQAVEERIQRRGPVVAGVAVASTGVGLPHLEQCVGDGFSVAVEYAAVNDDALSLCFAAVGNGQVV